MHPIILIGLVAVLIIAFVVVKEFVIPAVLGTGLFTNPVTQAKAEAIIIKAQTDAEISQWYANQRIAEANAALHNQTVATDLMTTTFSSLLFIAGCATILIIVAFVLYTIRNGSGGSRGGQYRMSYQNGNSITYVDNEHLIVNGRWYKVDNGSYYFENPDKIYAYLEGEEQ